MRRLAPLLAFTMLAAACADDGGTTDAAPPTTNASSSTTTSAPPAPTSSTTTTEPAPTIRASAGCDTPTEVMTGQSADGFTTADGRERTYRLYVPTSYNGDPTPLVLNFHGFTSNGDQQAGLSGFEPVAETEGFIVVHPFGTTEPGLGQTYWNTAIDDDPATVDDVAFVAELIDRLETGLCIDLDRVHSTGMSNGGYMSSRLACDLADRIASIGTVTAVSYGDDCTPARAVPVVHFHGRDDPIVPFEGGASTIFDVVEIDVEVDDDTLAEFFVAIPGEVAEWAARSGCSPEPEVREISAEVELRDYAGCTEGEVDFYVFEGGHTWPGSETMLGLESIVGGTTLDVDATQLIWEWFVDHPLA